MILHIFNTLAPVFIVIALGAVLAKGGLLKPEVIRGVNRLIFWVALPALLFIGTATADYRAVGVGRVLGVLTVILLIATAMGIIYARFARLAPNSAGTFVHVCVRANLSFVGLPVVFYILDGRPDAATVRAITFLVLAPYILIQNVVGLIALLAPQHRPGWTMLRVVTREMLTHPVILSTALGGILAYFRVPIPLALARSFDAVAAIASPLALIVIGAALLSVRIRGNRLTALAGSFIKIVVMPALGWIAGMWLGIGPEAMMVMLVFLACPTGASSFSLVSEMGGDEAIASTSIVLSTLLCVIPIALIVALYGGV